MTDNIKNTVFGADDGQRLQFCLYEYWQLRTEIRDRLQSIRNIVLGCYAAVGGVIAGVLALYAAAPNRLDLAALVLLAPFIAIIPAFSFVTSEELSIAILARYIRLHVELPFFSDSINRREAGDRTVHLPFGWETYLFVIRDSQMRVDSLDRESRNSEGLTAMSTIAQLLRRVLYASTKDLRTLPRDLRAIVFPESGDTTGPLIPGTRAELRSDTDTAQTPSARHDDDPVTKFLNSCVATFSDQNKAAIRFATKRDRHQIRAVSRFFRLACFSSLTGSMVAAFFFAYGEGYVAEAPIKWVLCWCALWSIGFHGCVRQTMRLSSDLRECWHDSKYVDVDSLPVEMCKSHLKFFQKGTEDVSC